MRARLLAVAALALLLASCALYRGIVIGTPFHADKITIPSGAAIGFPL